MNWTDFIIAIRQGLIPSKKELVDGTTKVGDSKKLDGHGAEYFASAEAVKKNTLWETLTANFDLNIALGKYRQYSGAIVKTLLNLPPTTLSLSSCEIAVDWLPFSSNHLYGIQEVTISNSNGKEIWFRRKDEGNWSAWERIFTTAGGTVNGNLVVDHKANSAVETNIRVKNTLCELLLDASAGGNMGLWSGTHGKWILKTDQNGATILDGTATGNLPLGGGMLASAGYLNQLKLNRKGDCNKM